MKKIVDFFELDRPYEFDATDITAFIYTACAVGAILGANMTALFLLGSIIGTIFCFKARRINLIVLNVALLVLNLYNFIIMIVGG
jgi:hypothetical protein